MIAPPAEVGAEELIANLVLWLRLALEAVGALIIGFGMVLAGLRFLRHPLASNLAAFAYVRLTFARFLAVALEFQLGADILSTAVAPTWEAIGKLAAIAVIRTALNYFLSQEMHQEAVPAP